MGRDIESGDHVGKWVAQRINGVFHPGSVAIGLSRGGELIAGVIYEQWNGRSLVAHMAVEGRLTPTYIAAIFDYAYNVANVRKVILPVGSQNAKSIRFVHNLGFREEARVKDAAPDGDIVIYTLEKSDCRFLGERFNGKITATSAAAA